jgi:SanA protein
MVNVSRRKILICGLVFVDFVVVGAIAANLAVASAAKNKTYSDTGQIPHRRVGLVLGCPERLSDGRFNLFFEARVRAAAELYRQGKVDYLLASGDKSTPDDDEPADLKRELVSQGVPGEKIYLDYAGFSTLDSVFRAEDLFDRSEITVISQEFQNQRAIFIASHTGLDAIGFNADDVFSVRNVLRESLARVKAGLDVYVFRKRRRPLGQTQYFAPKTKVDYARAS